MADPLPPDEALARIQEAALEGNVEWADSSRCEELYEHVGRVCDAVRVAADLRRRPIVTDLSSMSDFRGEGEDRTAFLERVSELLGIDVGAHDSVVDVAERLRRSELQ
jgi:hypothetical protein